MHYAETGKGADFDNEFTYAMGDDVILEEWALSNMNWEDVVSVARKVSSGETDFQEGWVNGDKAFIHSEVPDTIDEEFVLAETEKLAAFVLGNLSTEVGRGGSESAADIAILLLKQAWGSDSDPGPMRVARVCQTVSMTPDSTFHEEGLALTVNHEPLSGYTGIEMLGISLWDTETDDREYTDEGDGESEREPLLGFLRRRLSGLARVFGSLASEVEESKEATDEPS